MTKNCNFIDKLREIGLRPTKQRVKICEFYLIEKKLFILQLMILLKKFLRDE
jgi:Fur family iron response transcriptional regulator